MAQVTITGTMKDSKGIVPTQGEIRFELNNDMTNAAGVVIVRQIQAAVVSAVNGTFSTILESSTDCVPADRMYKVTFVGVLSGQSTISPIGYFTLAPSPTTRTLASLITITQ